MNIEMRIIFHLLLIGVARALLLPAAPWGLQMQDKLGKTLALSGSGYDEVDMQTMAMFASASMVMAAPLHAVRMDEVEWLQKRLTAAQRANTCVVTKPRLLAAVDGSPFVLMADHVRATTFCVFDGAQEDAVLYAPAIQNNKA